MDPSKAKAQPLKCLLCSATLLMPSSIERGVCYDCPWNPKAPAVPPSPAPSLCCPGCEAGPGDCECPEVSA